MSMSLKEGREFVRQSAPNAQFSKAFTDSEIDRAILTVGNDFMVKTKCVRDTGNVQALVDYNGTASLSSWSTFRPEFLADVELLHPVNADGITHNASDVDYIVGEMVVSSGKLYVCTVSHSSSIDNAPDTGDDWETVWKRTTTDVIHDLKHRTYRTTQDNLANSGTSGSYYNNAHFNNTSLPFSGNTPQLIGFSGTNIAVVYPAPGTTNYRVRAFCYAPFNMTRSNIGISESAGTNVVFNIPDEYMYDILWDGVPAFLNHADPDQGYMRESRARYTEFRDNVADNLDQNHGISELVDTPYENMEGRL